MEYKQEVFPIKGMHCSRCESVIERILREMSGVKTASVSFSKKEASISYDSNRLSKDDFNRELGSIGYEIGYDFSILDKIKELFRRCKQY
ncbi:MAG: heavy-metal-associated domain-containing protein [Nanoarchaeota archaeon]|nr:heavy-metal-associated domain-containing protein [Nanoarchaeota archaeon]